MIAEGFADIAAGFSAALGGPFYNSVVRTISNAALDQGGSIEAFGTIHERACLAQVDAVTEAMRAQDGFTDKDVRILILASSLPGDLDTDATIEVLAGSNAGNWSLQSVDTDPMGVYFECRGRRL